MSASSKRKEIIYRWMGWHHYDNSKMAKLLHVSPSTYGRWMQQSFSNNTITELISIIDLLGIPEEDAFELLIAGSRSIAKCRKSMNSKGA